MLSNFSIFAFYSSMHSLPSPELLEKLDKADFDRDSVPAHLYRGKNHVKKRSLDSLNT
jgi:hypothetical protein